MSEPPTSTPETPSDPRTKPRSSLYAFVRERDGVEVCVLYPPTVVVPHRSNVWIRARSDAVRSLAECR
ncbi:MAG: hypothetical protein PPP58_05835 [Natronomonas sp.]